MKKTVYFHIGQGKTGTTSIQSFLYTNREILREKYDLDYPVFYEVAETSLEHQRYVERMGRTKNGLYEFISYEGVPDFHTRLCTYIDSSTSSRFLISNETLAHCSYFELWKELDYSKYDVKIIISLRRPIEMLVSIWNTHFLGFEINLGTYNMVPPLEDYVADDHFYTIQSLEALLELGDMYGCDNIMLWPFEPEFFKNGSIYDDFLAMFDIEVTSEFVTTNSKNSSMSRKECDLINFFFPVYKYVGYDRHDLDKLCSMVKGDDRLPIETLSDSFIESISLLHDEILEEYSKKFYACKPIFKRRYPKCYKNDRREYIALTFWEKCKIYKYIIKKAGGLKAFGSLKVLCNYFPRIKRVLAVIIGMIPVSKFRRKMRKKYE